MLWHDLSRQTTSLRQKCVFQRAVSDTKKSALKRPESYSGRTKALQRVYCSSNHYAHNKNASRPILCDTCRPRTASLFFVFVVDFVFYLFRSLAAQEHILLSTLFIFFLFYCVHAVEHFSCERSVREREYCIVCAHKTMTFRHMEKKPLFVRIVPLIGWQWLSSKFHTDRGHV